MMGRLFIFIYLFIVLTQISGQPDSRFRPFDWVLYRGAGSITSITEGYTFAYIGTESGGLKRFNLFGNNFDDPITTAQGLKDNHITATHFDMQTGLIWVASPDHIQYSFSREGDWYANDLQTIGLSRYDRIKRIGSSSNFIWLQARSSFIKLDHSSGTLIGIYPSPDEISIQWSSGPYTGQSDLNEIFMNYSVMDGWILNGDDLIDRLGRRIPITTGFIGRHGNVFAGAEDGTVFYGTTTMETFSPLIPDISNTDVTAIYDDGNTLWLGSQDFVSSKGISWMDPRSIESQVYSFEETINMTPSPIFSLYATDSELWAGGDNILLVFDRKEDFWRTLGEERGAPPGKIWDLYGDPVHVWTGSSMGLRRIERSTRREDPIGIEYLFNQVPVYDIEGIEDKIWIGSRSGIFIYSEDNPQLRQGHDMGRKDFPEQMHRITAIQEFERVIYVVGDMGIAKFDMEEKVWDLIFTSGVYHDKTVYSLAVNKRYLFLATEDGLVRVNKKTGFVKDYSFSFLGQGNEIVLEGNTLWLGTSNGLVKFKWKRDL